MVVVAAKDAARLRHDRSQAKPNGAGANPYAAEDETDPGAAVDRRA